jgi:hypothetical protein
LYNKMTVISNVEGRVTLIFLSTYHRFQTHLKDTDTWPYFKYVMPLANLNNNKLINYCILAH